MQTPAPAALRQVVRTFIAAGLAGLAAVQPAAAAPITFNTALPVARGEFVWRELFMYRERDTGDAEARRQVDAWALANVLGYGLSGDLALFGVLPYVHKELNVAMPGSEVRREEGGPGDLRLFARYTAFALNRPGRTFRLAPNAGLIAPTGDDDRADAFGVQPKPLQPGLGAWGGFGGVVATYQSLQYQVDTQLQYEFRGTEDGFAAGDIFRFETSFQYRIWPAELSSGTPGFLYLVQEHLACCFVPS